MATDHQSSMSAAEERELKALEAGLGGRPVDADLADFAALAADLKATRPQPDELYVAELNQAVADGFPPDWSEDQARRPRRSFFVRLASRIGFGREGFAPIATGLAGLLVVIVASAITFGGNQSGSNIDDAGNPQTAGATANQAQGGAGAPIPEAASATLDRRLEAESGRASGIVPFSAGAENREVARSVRITLATPAEDLQDTSNRIIEVADSFNGIVMQSSVSGSDNGGRASFSLLIPSGKAEAAVAELSSVADLRSRTQQSVDITAPTVSAAEQLRTARARLDSFVNELSETTTEEERQAVGRKISGTRQVISWLNRDLKRLEQRVSFTPVNVSVETGEGIGSDSGWSIGDAVGDAGHLLAVSAGVAVVALAVAIPIGLMVLIALAINRAWLRRSRERALRDD